MPTPVVGKRKEKGKKKFRVKRKEKIVLSAYALLSPQYSLIESSK